MEDDIISFQVSILGDSKVGKTCFLSCFCDDNYIFNENNLSSIGFDSKIKKIERNNKKIHLKIYDTCGQERFRSIVKNYYKGADGVLLMYDSSLKTSFDSIDNWIKNLKDDIDISNKLVVVGNKCDLITENKVVTDKMKQNFEENYGIKIIEASAKDNINVEKSFIELIDKMLLKKEEEESLTNSLKISVKNIKKEKKNSCC